jgi:uncharacterized membrane protein
MTSELNKKIVLFISLGLLVWLAGITITPVLGAAAYPFSRKLTAFAYFFYQPVCHQIPDRSFWIGDFTMTVCIRCFSFYLGGFCILLFILFRNKINRWKMSTYFLLMMPAIVDFLLEKFNLYTNFEGLRFFTGLVFGIALFHLLILSVAVRDQKTVDKNPKIPNLAVRLLQDNKFR